MKKEYKVLIVLVSIICISLLQIGHNTGYSRFCTLIYNVSSGIFSNVKFCFLITDDFSFVFFNDDIVVMNN